MKIIVTPDDHHVDKEQFSFFIYDLKSKEIIYKEKKHDELICLNYSYDINEGRTAFRPFGIEVNDENIYIASNSKLAIFDKKTYKYKNNLNYPLFANTHQIIQSNNTFYICNTAIDTIGIYEKEINHFNVVSKKIDNNIKEVKNCKDQDSVHVNSLYEHNEFIYYCLHYLNKKQSEFWRLNKNTLETEYLIDAGHSSHNIVVYKNTLYSLSSDTGEIIEYNLNTKNLKYYLAVVSEITFLRGLAIVEGKLYFGASNNFKVIPRIEKNCNIFSFDFKSKKIDHVIHLDGIYTITDFKVFD